MVGSTCSGFSENRASSALACRRTARSALINAEALLLGPPTLPNVPRCDPGRPMSTPPIAPYRHLRPSFAACAVKHSPRAREWNKSAAEGLSLMWGEIAAAISVAYGHLTAMGYRRANKAPLITKGCGLEPNQHLTLTRLRDGLVHKRQSIDSARSLQLIAFQEMSPSKDRHPISAGAL